MHVCLRVSVVPVLSNVHCVDVNFVDMNRVVRLL